MTSLSTDLNMIGPEVQTMIKELLSKHKITEYSQVVTILNSNLLEPKLFISVEMDTLPDLDWNDGSMSMTLKCVRHLKSYEPKRVKSDLDADAERRRKNARR